MAGRSSDGVATYLARAYTYNADGSVESVKDYYNFKSGNTTSHALLTYGYDVFGRVSAMGYTKDGMAFEKHAYSYDKNNNITRERSVNALAGTDEVREEYSYDYRNQLAPFTVKDVITETVTVEGEADEDGNLKSFNLLNETDDFGTERKDGSGHDYYLYTDDARGSTVNILDNTGMTTSAMWRRARLPPYSSFENELQYTGAVHDGMTGLLYLNARYYEPRTGRFITRDSYRGERENADTWHLYAYCMNNPINYVDPSGHARSFGIYSAKHTFKYKFWKIFLVSVTLKINWEVSKNKIISCKAKITRKKTTKFTGIKKLKISGVKMTNRKQRARVRAFMMIEAKHVISLPLKYAFPVPSFYHPSAIVYNDGAADWYKNGLDNGVTSL